MRVALLEEQLLRCDPHDIVSDLNRVLRLMQVRRTAILHVYHAFAILMARWQTVHRSDMQDLVEIAEDLNHVDVSLLLQPSDDLVGEEQADGYLLSRTLGEQKSLARRANVRDLERFFGLNHIQVASIILDNPYLTEKLAVRYAARRPQAFGLGEALLEHRRWIQIPDVIDAYVANASAPSQPRRLLVPLASREGIEMAAHAYTDCPIASRLLQCYAGYLEEKPL